MARLKFELPTHFSFSTVIPIRITDLNYGGHIGNDTILSLIHEARVLYLQHFGYTELNLEGASLIMGEVAIIYKAELFYGDRLTIYVAAGEFTRVGFELFYKLVKGDQEILVAEAKTGMVCYDYTAKKVITVPAPVKEKLGG